MNGKQLKNSILQWAIQGKLVPQDPNDEPASVLLEKIRAEKARLVNEGKLKKKDLEVRPITEDEISFEIPESWEWCRLGDIGIFERGNGIKRDETCEQGWPCVRYGEMYTKYKYAPIFEKTFSFTNKTVFDKCRKAHKGDLFMALTGENKQDISLAAQYIGEEEIAVGGDLCHFTILEAYSLYFVYLINSIYFSSKKEVLATGDIIVHISTDKLASITIPLPPLAEQHRIVAKIEELMPLVEKYGETQEALEEWNNSLPEKLKKSILQEAIQGKLVPQDPNDEPALVLLECLRKEKLRLVKEGHIYKKKGTLPLFSEEDGPFEIPNNWVWAQLSDVSIIQEGAGIRKHQYTQEGTQLLCVTNILDGRIDLKKKLLFVSNEEYKQKYQHLTPQIGDIVTACSGGSWGKVAIYNCTETVMLNTSTLRMRFFNDLADNMYLYYMCQSDFFKNQLSEQLVGIQPNFGYAHYSRIVFPLPPLAEQRRIVSKIEELFGVIKK